MSESKPTSAIEASNELVRWLQLLVLPLWARIVLVVVMLMIVSGSLALLAVGLFRRDKESIAAVIPLLTVALPVMLVVIALVFSQNGGKRLKLNTTMLLEKDLPQAITDNLAAKEKTIRLTTTAQGCRADYELTLGVEGAVPDAMIHFSVELNVRKVNLAFWLGGFDSPEQVSIDTPSLKPYSHVISGALAEGYRMNPVPARYFGTGKGYGLLFFRELEADFLLKPAARLYFCQDLSFFVRGVLEAQIDQAQGAAENSSAEHLI